MILRTAQSPWRAKRAAVRPTELVFDRPLLLLQSDDWGRVGVRDQEGFEQLRSTGILLGRNPYDFYTLETAEDISATAGLLKCHHDSTGRPPCLQMNFITANVDFPRWSTSAPGEIPLRFLADGLPGKWERPGLFEAYRCGIGDGVFHPALHGLTHFSRYAVARCFREGDDRHCLLHTLWQAETPYIYWRMPWIGYEYWDPEQSPAQRFLSAAEQRNIISQSVKAFERMFARRPVSACAPGYRANSDTQAAWAQHGIRVAQNGVRKLAPYVDENGLLQISRTINFEPAVHASFSLQQCLRATEESFASGIPAVVSVHSINFHSSLKNFRDTTLRFLDELLTALERKYPELLYVNDADLWEIVNRGRYGVEGQTYE